MTQLAGMARPPQSRARPEYLAWKRSTITPRTSPPPGPDCHGVIVPISARISPGDQPRRPVGDDEQRVGLALDAMGRRLRCWPTVLPSGIVALRGRLTHGPRSPAARRA